MENDVNELFLVSAFVLLASFLTAEWEFLLHDRQAILNLSQSALPKNVLSVAAPDWSDNVVQVGYRHEKLCTGSIQALLLLRLTSLIEFV